MRRHAVAWLCIGMALTCGAGLDLRAAAAETADWWQAQRELSTMLLEGKADLVRLVTDARAAPPTDAQGALFRVGVFLRAVMPRETIQALGDLQGLCPGLTSYQVASIYYDACDNAQAWEVAKAAVELFAANLVELSLEERLLRHLQGTGWTVDDVDRWLAERPPGVGAFWVKERLRFSTAHGRGDALAKALADGVRANPADLANVLVYLDALICARRGPEGKPDLAWLATTVKPTLATQAALIGARLVTLGDLASAAAFARQAIEIPLTDSEARELAMQCQVAMPDATVRAAFAVRCREDLATCLLGLGRNDEAQTWMVAAADLREKNQLGRNALLAGQVQGASGARVIEERLGAAGQASENDPAYWRDRARYYRGRQETALEDEALTRGLRLAVPQALPARPSKGSADQRAWLLSDYAAFLVRENRRAEAVALLRSELEAVPADSASAQAAARVLAFDLEKQVNVADAVLWTWLANRPRWEYVEERLLLRLLESAPREGLEAPFARAEELAQGSDASRAAALGGIMNRMGFPRRAVPLLERAVGAAADQPLREHAALMLFEAYLAAGDWQQAEPAFPAAARRLTPKEAPEWLGRVALCAARAGARADAMRLWSRVTNLSLAPQAALEELANAGLRDELVAHYRGLQRTYPTSAAPAAALQALGVGTEVPP